MYVVTLELHVYYSYDKVVRSYELVMEEINAQQELHSISC